MNLIKVGKNVMITDEKGEKYIIESPDDWVEIIDYFEKGVQPCYKIFVGEKSVECSEKHFIQKSNLEWVWAKDLNVGDEISLFVFCDKYF